MNPFLYGMARGYFEKRLSDREKKRVEEQRRREADAELNRRIQYSQALLDMQRRAQLEEEERRNALFNADLEQRNTLSQQPFDKVIRQAISASMPSGVPDVYEGVPKNNLSKSTMADLIADELAKRQAAEANATTNTNVQQQLGNEYLLEKIRLAAAQRKALQDKMAFARQPNGALSQGFDYKNFQEKQRSLTYTLEIVNKHIDEIQEQMAINGETPELLENLERLKRFRTIVENEMNPLVARDNYGTGQEALALLSQRLADSEKEEKSENQPKREPLEGVPRPEYNSWATIRELPEAVKNNFSKVARWLINLLSHKVERTQALPMPKSRGYRPPNLLR